MTVKRLVLVLPFVVACSDEVATSSKQSALTGDNGLAMNSLSTNGLWNNGIWDNGIWDNGIWDNGIWDNGTTGNGIWDNGIWDNHVWENGIWDNGIWDNGIWDNNPRAKEVLRTNPYTRQVLQYLYECAMPAGQGASIDIDGETTLELAGKIGVGINEDNTGWWESGKCDQTCQRWTSACLLARTNAYGVRVQISMRAPATAPQRIQDALRVDDSDPDPTKWESNQFRLREGGFYGNIFQTTPPAEGTTGPIVNTPVFYACAGPGSNVPALTKRFCSSQGDQSVIDVPGICVNTAGRTGVCDSADANGNVTSCHTTIGSQTKYDEVITVYLKEPISTCGNAVCEGSEANPEDAAYCPTDCHLGSWAQSYEQLFYSDVATYPGAGVAQIQSSAATPEGNVVIAGQAKSAFDLGCGPIAPTFHGVVISKLDTAGQCLWTRPTAASMPPRAIAIGHDPDRTIAIAGNAGPTSDDEQVYLATYNSDGTPKLPFTQLSNVGDGMPFSRAVVSRVAVDDQGNVIVGGSYRGPAIEFGAFRLPATGDFFGEPFFQDEAFVAKVAPNGTILWALDFQSDHPGVIGLAVAPDGDVYMATQQTLYKIEGNCNPTTTTTHCVRWEHSQGDGGYCAMGADRAGNVYAMSGAYGGLFDQRFVRRYSPSTGLPTWEAPQRWYAWSNRCDLVRAQLSVDESTGLVVTSGLYGGTYNTTADFGAGTFVGYGTAKAFVAAYNVADGRFAWAKNIPLVLWSNLSGVTASGGRVYLTGAYSGSMQVDNVMLVNSIPELIDHANSFIASFLQPPPTDITPPVIGGAKDRDGIAFQTIPASIVVEARSAAGAPVFFMLPTAIEDSGAGTNVACVPAPNTIFPIGINTVTCTATNARGLFTQAQFTVTVRDSIAPSMSNIPDDIVSATNTVPFASPKALDQVDGPVDVTCTPPSGFAFPFGETQVTCIATDRAGNSARARFFVTITTPPDTTPPSIPVANKIVEATGPAGAVVTYSVIATDNIDGDVPVTCSPESGSQFALQTTTVECTASDAAGNTATASFDVTVVDTTPPTLVVPQAVTATAVAGGTVVTFPTSATDIVSGAITPICTFASGSVFPVGVTPVTCTATDAHGNSATRSFDVRVQAQGNFFLQPINADGSSIFKLGSAVPVKFQLTGSSAGITNLVANLSVAKISNALSGTAMEATSPGAADSGSTFRYDATSNQYIFNLATGGLSKGTWELRVDTHDGALHTIRISLK